MNTTAATAPITGYDAQIGDVTDVNGVALKVVARTRATVTVDTGEALGYPFPFGATRKMTFLASDARTYTR